MLCIACGNQAAAVGRFCSSCDSRARSGALDRRRPLGGGQWQALWGIDYTPAPDQKWKRRQRRWSQCAIACAVILLIFFGKHYA
jgi:hypothetical protein